MVFNSNGKELSRKIIIDISSKIILTYVVANVSNSSGDVIVLRIDVLKIYCVLPRDKLSCKFEPCIAKLLKSIFLKIRCVLPCDITVIWSYVLCWFYSGFSLFIYFYLHFLFYLFCSVPVRRAVNPSLIVTYIMSYNIALSSIIDYCRHI